MPGDYMVTPYHRSIRDAIVEFGKNKYVRKILRGETYPLPIVDPRSKHVVNYKPDVYFKLKKGGKIIFQVLESELKKQDTLIADVVRACLVEDCKGIIFIHPSESEKDNTRVLEALDIIVRGLNRKGIPFEELPQSNGSYSITRNSAKNQNNIINKLKLLSKEDKWFK